MTDLQRRPATAAEIIEYFSKFSSRISFETYVMETFDHRTENGVRHIRRGNSKMRIIDGKPFVVRHGELHELKAEFFTLPTGRTFVAQATIRNH